MNKLKFKLPIAGVPFNTNNAWGFGGGIGLSFKFPNGIEYRTGTAYFRHQEPAEFDGFRDADGRRADYKQSLASIAEWLA